MLHSISRLLTILLLSLALAACGGATDDSTTDNSTGSADGGSGSDSGSGGDSGSGSGGSDGGDQKTTQDVYVSHARLIGQYLVTMRAMMKTSWEYEDWLLDALDGRAYAEYDDCGLESDCEPIEDPYRNYPDRFTLNCPAGGTMEVLVWSENTVVFHEEETDMDGNVTREAYGEFVRGMGDGIFEGFGIHGEQEVTTLAPNDCQVSTDSVKLTTNKPQTAISADYNGGFLEVIYNSQLVEEQYWPHGQDPGPQPSMSLWLVGLAPSELDGLYALDLSSDYLADKPYMVNGDGSRTFTMDTDFPGILDLTTSDFDDPEGTHQQVQFHSQAWTLDDLGPNYDAAGPSTEDYAFLSIDLSYGSGGEITPETLWGQAYGHVTSNGLEFSGTWPATLAAGSLEFEFTGGAIGSVMRVTVDPDPAYVLLDVDEDKDGTWDAQYRVPQDEVFGKPDTSKVLLFPETI